MLWCFVIVHKEIIQRQDCAIELCQDQPTTATVTQFLPVSFGEVQPEKSDNPPVQGQSGPVKTQEGISQPFRHGPMKKDLGVLGYVLATILMVIITMLGSGITAAFFYQSPGSSSSGGSRNKRHPLQRMTRWGQGAGRGPLRAWAGTSEEQDEHML
ncbi:hypothetical protein UPYG_G00283760 [Umbra pygmaea]|uniref:Uncharacterized protein n=1 Tax=Umbra pygmaea TaxID=75934 RepID=A0ABD0W7X1_UMBPY